MKLNSVPGHRDLKKDPVTGIIYVRMSRRDKHLFKSTGCKNIRDARKVADKLIQEFLGLKPKGSTILLIEELWPQWVATKDGKAKATLDSINYSAKRLLPFFGSLLPNEITPAAWEEYVLKSRQEEEVLKALDAKKGKLRPDHRFFNERKWLRMFILWSHENGYIEKCPRFRSVDPVRSDAGKYITHDEFKKLIEESHPDLQLQILMAYTMGMRISEIMCLTWGKDRVGTSFVDLEQKYICLHLKDTKIRKSRTFGISESVYKELVIRHWGKASEYLWPSLNDNSKPMGRQGNKTAWKLARARSGVKCRFHDLRHSFLTNAFKAAAGKIDSMLICEYAGLDITQAQDTYLHFDHEDTRAVSQLVKLDTGFQPVEKGDKNDY